VETSTRLDLLHRLDSKVSFGLLNQTSFLSFVGDTPIILASVPYLVTHRHQ
jgi:hypothetical protein